MRECPSNLAKCLMYSAIIDQENDKDDKARDKILHCLYVAKENNMSEIQGSANEFFEKLKTDIEKKYCDIFIIA